MRPRSPTIADAPKAADSLTDAARSSRRGCRPTERLPRTCRRPAWCDHNPVFRGSDKCASSRSPKRRSLLGSGIALPALKRIDPLQSEPARRSSRARALGQAQPAVAMETGSGLRLRWRGRRGWRRSRSRRSETSLRRRARCRGETSSAFLQELRPGLAVRCSVGFGRLPLRAALLHDALGVRRRT